MPRAPVTPVYVAGFDPTSRMLERFLAEVPWEQHTETRRECFMVPGDPYTYTYGEGRGVRSYTSIPMSALVGDVMDRLNDYLAWAHPAWGPMTGCFLNRYEDDHDHLGWHADDFDGMDHTKAVVSVSYGEVRDIWWRPFGAQGEVLFESGGEAHGWIADEPRGTHGFGYDPIFVGQDTFGKTYAEIDPVRKNLRSHRKRVLAEFALWAARAMKDGTTVTIRVGNDDPLTVKISEFLADIDAMSAQCDS